MSTEKEQLEKKEAFSLHEKEQYLQIAEQTTPYERWLWLEESLEIFGETILKNKSLLPENR